MFSYNLLSSKKRRSDMKFHIFFLHVFITIFWELNAVPVELYDVKPLIISAPISQMQFHHRSTKNDIHEKNTEDYIKVKPKSFQMYFYNTGRKMSQKNYDSSSNFQPLTSEDNLALPSSFYYNVYHPRTRFAKPKSLHITFDPKLGDVTKLDLKDTFIDNLQPRATTEKPKYTTTTTRKPKRPTATTRCPKPQPKIKSHHQIDQELPPSIIEETYSNSTEKPITPYGQQTSNLAGQSQIGNRESQMVIKPTVIVNIRGTVSNHDSEIKLESRNIDGNVYNMTRLPYGIFNINQEINIDKTFKMPKDNNEEMNLRFSKTIHMNDDDQNESKSSEEVTEILSESVSVQNDEKAVSTTEIRRSRSENFDDLSADKNSSGRVPRKIYVFEVGPLGGFKNV